jgi:hypothetical protein
MGDSLKRNRSAESFFKPGTANPGAGPAEGLHAGRFDIQDITYGGISFDTNQKIMPPKIKKVVSLRHNFAILTY